MTLGLYLKEKRVRERLTQEALAAKCRSIAPHLRGFHGNAITFWETGSRGREPSLAQFYVLATALRLSVEEQLHALRLCSEALVAA